MTKPIHNGIVLVGTNGRLGYKHMFWTGHVLGTAHGILYSSCPLCFCG